MLNNYFIWTKDDLLTHLTIVVRKAIQTLITFDQYHFYLRVQNKPEARRENNASKVRTGITDHKRRAGIVAWVIETLSYLVESEATWNFTETNRRWKANGLRLKRLWN